MTKTKKNFRNIFKTFALAFTTLALMLGVLVSNALPKVSAQEQGFPEDLSKYSVEVLEKGANVADAYILIPLIEGSETGLNISGFTSDVTDEFNKKITMFTNYVEGELYYMVEDLDNMPVYDLDCDFIEFEGNEYFAVKISSNRTFNLNYFEERNELFLDKYETISLISNENIYCSYVYQDYLGEDEEYEERDFYVLRLIEEPTVEPETPSDEPTVEPDEPTVEPDEPTDDNSQEDNSSDVVEVKDNFIEMVGNTTIEVFGLENLSAYSAGIATLGAFVSFIVVAGVVIAIIWVSKK